MSPKWQRDSALRDLFAVATIPEASRRWGKHENTVRWALAAGKLDARLSGGTWLITTHSLIKLWGKPNLGPDLNTVEFSLPIFRRIS